MSVLEEFDTVLNEINGLKPPGVSGSRIKKLTELAIKNISLEADLVNKIINFCKSAPSSHKLGALYIIDSVSRGFQSEARKVDNQRINYDNVEALTVNDGTYLSGLLRLNNSIETLLDGSLSAINDDGQKEKIRKLLDIWSKAGTFDKNLLQNVRNKYYESDKQSSNGSSVNDAANNKDPSAILKSLASLAGPAPASHSSQAPQPSQSPPQVSVPLQQQQQPGNPPLPFPLPTGDGQQAPDPNAIFQMLQQMQQSQQFQQPQQQQDNQDYHQNQGYHQDQDYRQNSYNANENYNNNDNYNNHDNHNNYNNGGGRSRYGNQYSQEELFNQHSGGRRGGGPGRRGGRNRSRSPNRSFGGGYNDNRTYHDRRGLNRSQKVNTAETALLNPGERNTPGTPHFRVRNVSHDPNLPANSIKVLSRTLFIGGITNNMDERALASILRPFAEVQSVILNVPKKHAFVKVYSRAEAVNVISSFNKDGQYNLRLRWGVGFGPRDCCDYQHGISIIPLARLTDADKRWIVSAEWGGTGGASLVPGIVVDEPDIEIGKGVSSKAISKKMPTDGSRNGPKSTKPGEPDDIYTDPLSQPSGAIPAISKEANPLANLFGNNNNNGPNNGPIGGIPAGISAGIPGLNNLPLGQSPLNSFNSNQQPNNVPVNNDNGASNNNNAAAVAALLGSIPGLSGAPGLSALLQQSANQNNNGGN